MGPETIMGMLYFVGKIAMLYDSGILILETNYFLGSR